MTCSASDKVVDYETDFGYLCLSCLLCPNASEWIGTYFQLKGIAFTENSPHHPELLLQLRNFNVFSRIFYSILRSLKQSIGTH